MPLPKPLIRPIAAAREDIWIVAEPGLRLDDPARGIRQHEHAAGILLARRLGNRPLTRVRNVGPSHAADFFAPLRGQKGNSDQSAERSVVLGRLPYRADFIVGQDAGARLRMGRLPPHAAHDRRVVVVVPRQRTSS